MTLQQLEYIIAVDQHRHFARAAEHCNITQSTLSSMVQKLENELDVQIFDRKKHPITTTGIGEKIVSQAKNIVYNVSQIEELVLCEKTIIEGNVTLGIIPTIAPYIIPKLIGIIKSKFPAVNMLITEAPTAVLISKLESGNLDMALMATPINNDNILEIPIYYEKFIAYVSPSESIYNHEEINVRELTTNNLWVLHEGHCWRNQVLNICERASDVSTNYQAGSIDTLVKIIDQNGGYTIIPELHKDLLNEQQKLNIRKIVEPEPVREVSLTIQKDFIREKMLNAIADCIKLCVPPEMIDDRLRKFRIKL